MSDSVELDDRALRQLIDDLDEKQRAKVLRSSLRSAAGKVKKAAVANMAAGLKRQRKTADMAKGVRAITWRSKSGFTVTLVPALGKKTRSSGDVKKGYFVNRYGKQVPTSLVLRTLNSGTRERRTKGPMKKRHWWSRTRRVPGKGLNRGRIEGYDFMQKTIDSKRSEVTNDMKQAVVKFVIKAARKNGFSAG